MAWIGEMKLVHSLRSANKRNLALECLTQLLKMLAGGCFHSDKSWPFTVNGATYRVCVRCGARRRFDLDQWKMYGPYFFAAEEGRSQQRSGTRVTKRSNVLPMRHAA